jgi:hypothetical protein
MKQIKPNSETLNHDGSVDRQEKMAPDDNIGRRYATTLGNHSPDHFSTRRRFPRLSGVFASEAKQSRGAATA